MTRLNSNNANLNYEIAEKETTEASRKLKNNKASALDLIKNEMIKSALPVLNKPILIIFNTILTTGQFPRSWTDGIIVPVHKQGS